MKLAHEPQGQGKLLEPLDPVLQRRDVIGNLAQIVGAPVNGHPDLGLQQFLQGGPSAFDAARVC